MKLEMDARELRPRSAIPDHVVGAPLKRDVRVEPFTGGRTIPDHVVGAPLKHRPELRAPAAPPPIPDHVVGAPLKLRPRPDIALVLGRSPTTWSGPR